MMSSKILITVVVVFISVHTYSQVLQKNHQFEKTIDSIFQSINNEKSPGAAITVLQNGKVIAKRNYGMASLEHKVPFTHQSVVRFGYSDTREFMCAGLAIMEKEGLLRFDDKVRKYFPKLPAWSEMVTLQDLLNHSSGFDDEWATLLLTQQSMTNHLERSQSLSLLYNQPAPQVEPGKGYMYCNSDFALLHMIMEAASGKRLALYLQDKLFQPLGMNATFMETGLGNIIPNLAETYYGNGQFERAWKVKTSPGGNYRIVTNALDLAKWIQACNNKESFVAKAFERLYEQARPIPVLEQQHFTFGSETEMINGVKVIKHGGINDIVYATRIPDRNIDVLIVSNNPLYFKWAENVVNYLLNHQQTENDFYRKYALKPAQISKEKLLKYAGRYWVENAGTASSHLKRIRYCDLKLEGDTLQFYITKNDFFPLIPVGENLFKDPDYPTIFQFDQPHPDSAMRLEAVEVNGVFEKMRRSNPVNAVSNPAKEYLQQFTGRYYSKHLDYYFTVILNDQNELVLKRPTIADKLIEPYAANQFIFYMEDGMSNGWNVLMKFTFDSNNTVTGFDLQHIRMMHHRFDKVIQ